MRGFELKRIVEILWKNQTAVDEKTPIVQKKNTLTDNGTLPMNRSLSTDDIFRSTNGKRCLNDSNEFKKEPLQKMSLLRKLCFFLSINTGVLYVLVFAWLLPCRLSPCFESEDSWTLNLTNMQMTTNLETYTQTNPTLAIFGYSNQDDGGYIGAVRISDGKQVWNRSTQEIPREVWCNFKGIDIKMNRNRNCFVTADSLIAAFDPSNGDVIWQRDLSSDQTIRKVSITHGSKNKSYLIGIADEYMYLIDVLNGTEVSKISLPCSWTIDVKIAGPWITKGGPLWALVCEYGDGIQVWTFRESELIKLSNKTDFEISRDDVQFNLLFSKLSYSGSIDLAGDVTSTSRSLFLSWADMVVMVTAQAPFHHLHKAWEQRFSSPLGYVVDVTCITAGHFLDSKTMQIAVAVKNGLNSTIHLLELNNGSSVVETELGPRTVISLKKIEGDNREKDTILIESRQIENSSTANSTNSALGLRTYMTIQYKDSKATLRHIITSEDVYASSLSMISGGNFNLLLAKEVLGGDLIVHRLVIKNRNPEKNLCNDERKNSSTVMFME